MRRFKKSPDTGKLYKATSGVLIVTTGATNECRCESECCHCRGCLRVTVAFSGIQPRTCDCADGDEDPALRGYAEFTGSPNQTLTADLVGAQACRGSAGEIFGPGVPVFANFAILDLGELPSPYEVAQRRCSDGVIVAGSTSNRVGLQFGLIEDIFGSNEPGEECADIITFVGVVITLGGEGRFEFPGAACREVDSFGVVSALDRWVLLPGTYAAVPNFHRCDCPHYITPGNGGTCTLTVERVPCPSCETCDVYTYKSLCGAVMTVSTELDVACGDGPGSTERAREPEDPVGEYYKTIRVCHGAAAPATPTHAPCTTCTRYRWTADKYDAEDGWTIEGPEVTTGLPCPGVLDTGWVLADFNEGWQRDKFVCDGCPPPDPPADDPDPPSRRVCPPENLCDVWTFTARISTGEILLASVEAGVPCDDGPPVPEFWVRAAQCEGCPVPNSATRVMVVCAGDPKPDPGTPYGGSGSLMAPPDEASSPPSESPAEMRAAPAPAARRQARPKPTPRTVELQQLNHAACKGCEHYNGDAPGGEAVNCDRGCQTCQGVPKAGPVSLSVGKCREGKWT